MDLVANQHVGGVGRAVPDGGGVAAAVGNGEFLTLIVQVEEVAPLAGGAVFGAIGDVTVGALDLSALILAHTRERVGRTTFLGRVRDLIVPALCYYVGD